MSRWFLFVVGLVWMVCLPSAWGQTSSKVHEGFAIIVYGGTHSMEPKLHAGGGLATSNWTLSEETIGLATGAVSSTSVWFGVFYWGIEASAGYNGGEEYTGGGAGADRYVFEPEWNVDLSVEAGMPFKNWLVYAKGGASFIGGTGKAPLRDPPGEEDLWALGYLLGGGVEFAFESGFFVRGEYLFHDYKVRQSGEPSITGEAHSFRGGIGFRL